MLGSCCSRKVSAYFWSTLYAARGECAVAALFVESQVLDGPEFELVSLPNVNVQGPDPVPPPASELRLERPNAFAHGEHAQIVEDFRHRGSGWSEGVVEAAAEA